MIDLSDWVVGDGITDDTAAMAALAAHVNSLPTGAAIQWGRLTPKIIGSVTFTKSLSLFGEHPAGSKLLCFNNASLILNGGTRVEYGGTDFIIERIGIETDGVSISAPLQVTYGGGLTLLGSLYMVNSYVAGRNETSGCTTGIQLHNVGFANFHEVRVMGNRSGPVPSGSIGLSITGDGGSTIAEGLRVYFFKTGVSIYGDSEGHIFNGGEIVGALKGILARDGTGGFQPYLVVTNYHINVEESGVQTVSYTEIDIGRGCDFYGLGFDGTGDGTWTAIDIDPGPALYTNNAKIDVSMIQGDNHYAATATGVRVRAGPDGSQQQISINGKFQSLNTGIELDVGTFGIRVSRECAYANCSTRVLNLGNNTVDMLGPGSPEGVLASAPGGTYSSYDNGNFYRKGSGSGNVGWIAT